MENIEVALRIRPINQQEIENNDIEVWNTQGNDVVGISAEKYSDLIRMRKIAPGQKTQYLFNKCLDSRISNSTVYEQVVKRIALSSLKGINGTIFMYGQTGSGKTFTMMGSNREDGFYNINNNSKNNLSSFNQYQIGQATQKLVGDPLSPKNGISKESSSRLSRQQSSHKNLVSQYKPSNFYQQQYYSKSPPKQRDSSTLNNDSKENQFNSSQLVINTLRSDKQPNFGNSTGIGAFKNSPISFSPLNSYENFLKKKNPTQQCGLQNRSQSVTPDKYLSSNSQKSQTLNGVQTSSNVLEQMQDSQSCMQNNGTSSEGFNSLSQSSVNSNQYGVLILSLIDIFKEIQNSPDNQFLLRCSYVEIYTDFVYDLLKPQDKLTETLQIGEDYNKEFFIKGAVEEIISSIEEIIQLLKYGEYNRHYASTAMNHISSRSHTIFRLYVRSMPKDFTNGNEGITESILNFVDLAGSEKINIHNINNKVNNLYTGGTQTNNSVRDRQIESKTINKSLFFLTQVISLKSQGKQETHIPYRNSPLTKILRSSLGGNSRTAIILCINPCLSQLEQTSSTLRFGLNAKKIENQVKQNVIQLQNNDILQSMIKEYETRIVELESEKNVDKVNSENLVQMISSLIEQKNNLEKRIYAKEMFDLKQSFQRQMAMGIKNRKTLQQDFVHLNNVGLIKVYDSWDQFSQKPNSSRDISKEIQANKCAMRKIKSFNEQKRVQDDQIQNLKFLISQKDVESTKIMQRLNKKLAEKKRKLQTMKANKITLGIENSRLKQELALYKNQNIEGLKKLSQSKLEKLDQNVELLQKNIRNQMNMLALKREFEGDTTVLQRLTKTLKLREQMDCELLELANDFFEPNLLLNTTLQDEDDSMMYADINDDLHFQYHNIYNMTSLANQNLFSQNSMPIQAQIPNQKYKPVPESSSLFFGGSPTDTISCLSYKTAGDDQQLQFTNQIQPYNNHLQNTQINSNDKSIFNNIIGLTQDIQKGNSQTNNFGTFQNYFNQVNSMHKQNKQGIPTYPQTSEIIDLDSNGTKNIIEDQSNLQNNNYLAIEEQRQSDGGSYGNSKMSHQNIQYQPCNNKNQISKVSTQEDILGEKSYQNQFKIENNLIGTEPQKNTFGSFTSNSNSQRSNEIFTQTQTNISTNGLFVSENEQQTIQSMYQSQSTRLSGLDPKVVDSKYFNQDVQKMKNNGNQITGQSNASNINKSDIKPQSNTSNTQFQDAQVLYSAKSHNSQSQINAHNQKADQQQQQQQQPHPIRSCSQGQYFRSNIANDINCEASALTKDFQEPLTIEKQVKHHPYHNNHQPQQNKSRNDKSLSHQSQNSSSKNQNYHQPSNYEVILSEKKLVEKLFGKENKYQTDHSTQNQSKGISREGGLQTSKGIQNQYNNQQQQKYQKIQKNLSQKDIFEQKLQIVMNQNNSSNISNTTFTQLALQHKQNKNIVQQLMSQPNLQISNTHSQLNFVAQNTQGLQTPCQSPTSIQQNKQNIYQESGQSYLKFDSTLNRQSNQHTATK